MHSQYYTFAGTSRSTHPFVCRSVPFVGLNTPVTKPIVWKNIPFIGFKGFMRGFTLIELVVVLTVLGILVGIAAPALSSFVHSNRLVTATNDLVADISLARNEAIKRSRVTGVCKSADGTSCTNTGTWASGWIVFVDTDNSNGWSAGDEVVRTHETLTKITTPTTAADSVMFNRVGSISSGTGDYKICSGPIHQQRVINLSNTGRSSITSGSC